jgi:Replication-relaxation
MRERYLTTARYTELLTKLSEQDYAVLQQVATLHFVSGSQLTRLCFSDSDDERANVRAGRRALLRLVRLGTLERLERPIGGIRAGSAGFVYHLGLAGQRIAIDRGWQPERHARRSLTPGSLFVRHTLAVAELHTQLIESDRARRFELLELTAEPSCWRNFDGIGGQRTTLKPDSYVRLGLGTFEYSYFIEVDRGTEGSRALERQLQLYIACHASGVEQIERQVFPRVLWLTPDDRRSSVVIGSIERLPAEHGELFQVARFDEAIDRMLAGSDSDSPKLSSTSHDKIHE